jgi:hypothetical protein
MITRQEILDETGAEGSPPCEIFISGKPCGKPSAVRLRGKCTACPNMNYSFACAPCWGQMQWTWLWRAFLCARCGALAELSVS